MGESRAFCQAQAPIGKGRLLLISMPFPHLQVPSVQLGALAAYLKTQSIPIQVCHAYLDCADALTPELYQAVTATMWDEIFYSHFLYPDHYAAQYMKVSRYFEMFQKSHPQLDPISLEMALNRLRAFHERLFTAVDYSDYSLIGFTVTYDQLRPSIYLAQWIKQQHPNVRIVFGGAQCTGELGTSILETFPTVDFIVSGEGEQTLASLFLSLGKNQDQFEGIGGLGWREDGQVRFNPVVESVHPKSLPMPDYDEYFQRLDGCSDRLKDFVRNYLAIPVEGSRGCWWSKCTFCNLNMQYKGYREKPVEQVVAEVKAQATRYRCHNIRFVDNVQRIKGFDRFMTALKDLNLGLSIFMELRAGRLAKQDYLLMRDAGVKVVQIGVEAVGNRMLKNINKGVTAIDNVAAIKYCQECGILPFYNIIHSYPNEEEADLEETVRNIDGLRSLIPPMSIIPLGVGHGSPVQQRPAEFNIKDMARPKSSWQYPEHVLETLTPGFYSVRQIHESPNRTPEWQDAFSTWRQSGESIINSPRLIYRDGRCFLTITDMTKDTPVAVTLDGEQRELYLYCDQIRSIEEIQEHFPHVSLTTLQSTLDDWIARHWMFKEENRYLSLAIELRPEANPLVYWRILNPGVESHLDAWRPSRPAPPRWLLRWNLPRLAEIDIALKPKIKPRWLKRLIKQG